MGLLNRESWAALVLCLYDSYYAFKKMPLRYIAHNIK